MVLDGKIISDAILNNLNIKGKKLVVISVGNDKRAISYLRGIESKASKVGVIVEHLSLNSDTTNDEYIKQILLLNDTADAILLLTPLEEHLNLNEIVGNLDNKKDVDCLTKYNNGRFYLSTNEVVSPCTALAVMEIFKFNKYDLTSKKVCIVGASNIVGKPLTKLMLSANATVTVCNYYTNDLAKHTSESDIIVMACGVPKLLKKEYIKNNAIIIDVGINFVDGKLCGDVDYEDCSLKSKFITTVPGGVGSITSSIIFKNMSLLNK
ncbi:MAG: bifunctional 5,10-methylenetetrahydrofolate dehydrogenase/5,10-methenyltetrahydrofolate cyclohydrolase [Bacilli bacterium]